MRPNKLFSGAQAEDSVERWFTTFKRGSQQLSYRATLTWLIWRASRRLGLLKGVIKGDEGLSRGSLRKILSARMLPSKRRPPAVTSPSDHQALVDFALYAPPTHQNRPAKRRWREFLSRLADHMELMESEQLVWDVFVDDPWGSWLPPHQRLIELEGRIVLSTMQRLLNSSHLTVLTELSKRLPRAEAGAIMRLTHASINSIAGLDTETRRAVAVLRTEGFIERCRRSMQLNAEHKGHKLLAEITGLTRTHETTTIASMFKEIVGEVSHEQDDPGAAGGLEGSHFGPLQGGADQGSPPD